MSNYKLHWQSFPLNQKGRDFVVGDIHGHFALLQSQLNEINFNPEIDRLFSVGDNIDRGPQSKDVLEWFEKPWFFSIMGNHEVMALEYFKSQGSKWKNWEIHGGSWFMKMPRDEQEKYIEKFKTLPIVFEIDTMHGTVGIVHAECTPNDWWDFKLKFENYMDNALWGMGRFYTASNGKHNAIENILYVINGHMNVDEISKSENTIYIDTGALSKRLTLLEINHHDGLKFYN